MEVAEEGLEAAEVDGVAAEAAGVAEVLRRKFDVYT